ncbi:MAG: hypothetical protein R3F19_07300 [Verrucomicrobiales bacterium]
MQQSAHENKSRRPRLVGDANLLLGDVEFLADAVERAFDGKVRSATAAVELRIIGFAGQGAGNRDRVLVHIEPDV